MVRVYQDPKAPTLAGRRRWCIDYVDFTGRRCRTRTVATTKAEAEAILRRKLNDIAMAEITGVQTIQKLRSQTLEQFLREEYLPWCEPPRNRSSTFERKHALAKHVLRHLGKTPLHAIGPGDIERWMSLRLKEKTCRGSLASPAEVNRGRALLSAAFNMAVRRGLIDRNPVATVRMLNEDNERDRTLSHGEEDRIVEFAPEWLRPIIRVAVNTAMRKSEILAMKWSDIDRENGFIRVSHASKSHKVRHVPINAVVWEVLEDQEPFVGPDGPCPYVFVNPKRGRPFESSSVTHRFKKTAVKLGMDDVVFHTLRHTCVSRLVQAGVPDRKIMKMVGHSSPHMVSRYAHLAPDDLYGIADVLLRSAKGSNQVGNYLATFRGPRRAKS